MKNICAIDFEYCRPSDPDMGLVSVDLCFENGGHESIWLCDAGGKAKAVAIFEALRPDYTLLSFNVLAEASCFIALGLNPRGFEWVDLMLEYRQLQNCDNKYQYGYSWRPGVFAGWKKSTPTFSAADIESLNEVFGHEKEKMIKKLNAKPGDHLPVTCSLANCLMNILGVDINVLHKEAMRDIIINGQGVYTEDEKAQILGYGFDDTQHLIKLFHSMKKVLSKRVEKVGNTRTALDIMLNRGRFAANSAIYTMTGIPIDADRYENLLYNKPLVQSEAVIDFQSQWGNLWEYIPKDKRYSEKYQKVAEWVEDLEQKHKISWKRLPNDEDGNLGRYDMSDSPGSPRVAYHDLIPEIYAFNQLKKLLAGFKAHATPEEASKKRMVGKKSFSDSVGADSRLRPYYGLYGTQTSRNAPKATGFIFAQSGWLRGLINPAPGFVIAECDWGSQEAWIAAVLSRDLGMIEGYLSGDPYLSFAKQAEACPQDATKNSHGDIRNLFKATVLGLQYGMGALKLAIKLTADTGKGVSVEEAKVLIGLHKKAYPEYYAWKESLGERYRECGLPLSLNDGWYLGTDNISLTSVLNFPVQGNGAVMMRQAVDMALEQGINVLCPVHDSLVFQSREENFKRDEGIVKKCMVEASALVLGREFGDIRVGDASVLRHGEFWETEKNSKDLEKYKRYFLTKNETIQGSILERLLKD